MALDFSISVIPGSCIMHPQRLAEGATTKNQLEAADVLCPAVDVAF